MNAHPLAFLWIPILCSCSPSPAAAGKTTGTSPAGAASAATAAVQPMEGDSLAYRGEPSALAGDDVRDPVDVLISDQVRDAILRDSSLAPDSGAITVDTQAGIVTLRGFVGTRPLKDRAVTVVRAVGSVVRVDDQLVVDPEVVRNVGPMESSLDHAISFRVRQALQGDRSLSGVAPTLRITTRDGVVRIEGTVSSEAVRQRILTVVRAVGSVSRVDDQMTVAGK